MHKFSNIYSKNIRSLMFYESLYQILKSNFVFIINLKIIT